MAAVARRWFQKNSDLRKKSCDDFLHRRAPMICLLRSKQNWVSVRRTDIFILSGSWQQKAWKPLC